MTKLDKSEMTPAQKAAHTRKWRRASVLAHERAKNAKTFAKYILSQNGYKCISFDTRKGYEYKGVVDFVAVKRDNKEPDRLKIVLVQVKGGSARVTANEIKRLKVAAKKIRVNWNVAEKPGKTVQFRKGV